MDESRESSVNLSEGDFDECLKKTVKFLILQTDDFTVYIDTNLDIQWFHSEAFTADDNFGRVLNRVARLESSARFIEDKDCLLSIKRQIAEGIARYFDFKSLKLSTEIHDLVEAEIRELNIKESWGWYFNTAYAITIVCLICWICLWIAQDWVIPYIGKTGFDVVLSGLIGSVGAIISIITRGNKINLDANAGLRIHVTEGTARVIVGIAGAVVVALAYKSGLFLSGMKFFGSKFAGLLTLAIVAGASERLVPSLISKVESNASTK